MTPDHPDFDVLPKRQKAVIYKSLKWDTVIIAEELNVSVTTALRWTDPAYAERQRAHKREYGRRKARAERDRKATQADSIREFSCANHNP